MMISRFILSALLVSGLVACSPNEQAVQPNSSVSAVQADVPKKVAVTTIVDHLALDDIRRGVLDQLKEDGFQEGQNLIVDFQSAQGNTATAAQIAKKFVGDRPDLIVAISTPSAQAVLAATRDIPIIYSGVTDPISARLVDSWEPSGRNITGVSNQMDLVPIVELIRELLPNAQKIGYVYSPGEVNSVAMLDDLRMAAEPYGMSIVEAPAQTTAEVLTAARSLKGKVDIIFTGHDNNVVAAYPSMYKAAVEMQIPLVAADSHSVEKGAIAALGIDYYDLGRDTGKMATAVLNGEKKVGEMPSQRSTNFKLTISPKHASDQGIRLPESILSRANEVIE